MEGYRIQDLRMTPQLIPEAATWFSSKWQVPEQAYLDSMAASLEPGAVVPRWYVARDGEKIIAGIGVIENDFHDRKDLSPNVCAVYVVSYVSRDDCHYLDKIVLMERKRLVARVNVQGYIAFSLMYSCSRNCEIGVLGVSYNISLKAAQKSRFFLV